MVLLIMPSTQFALEHTWALCAEAFDLFVILTPRFLSALTPPKSHHIIPTRVNPPHVHHLTLIICHTSDHSTNSIQILLQHTPIILRVRPPKNLGLISKQHVAHQPIPQVTNKHWKQHWTQHRSLRNSVQHSPASRPTSPHTHPSPSTTPSYSTRQQRPRNTITLQLLQQRAASDASPSRRPWQNPNISHLRYRHRPPLP